MTPDSETCRLNATFREISDLLLTLEGHLAKLADIRDMALAAEDYSAANTAETNRGRVMGYYVEHRELVA